MLSRKSVLIRRIAVFIAVTIPAALLALLGLRQLKAAETREYYQ
jgi:hypothetical protein